MNNEKLLQALNEAFAWKYNSLAAYILAAEPYSTPAEAQILETVRSIAAEDEKARERILGLIEKREGIARMDTYHHSVGELNFLSIYYLQNVLRENLSLQLTTYKARAREFSSDADALALFSDLEKEAEAGLSRLG